MQHANLHMFLSTLKNHIVISTNYKYVDINRIFLFVLNDIIVYVMNGLLDRPVYSPV